MPNDDDHPAQEHIDALEKAKKYLAGVINTSPQGAAELGRIRTEQAIPRVQRGLTGSAATDLGK